VVEGEQYSIISLYAGATLKQCIEEKLLTEAQLEDVIAQVRATILRLHEVGVVHDDLHQQNICVVFVEEKVQAQVIDFGLVTFVADEYDENQRDDALENFDSLAEDVRSLLSKSSLS